MIQISIQGRWRPLPEVLQGPDPAALTEAEKNALALIRSWESGSQTFSFQTSGSTGKPKSIEFSRSQLETSARISEKVLGLRQGYVALLALDPMFIAGAMMIVRSLVTRMDLIIQTPSTDALSDMKNPVDFIALVPYQAEKFISHSPDFFRTIRIVLLGGAHVPQALSKKIAGMDNQVYATYGMTETITHIALQKLSGQNHDDCFHLLPGFSAKVDSRGCLVVSAHHLGPAPIVTNDVVKFLAPDRFLVLGRIDRVINSGGFKVNPEHVETTIEQVFIALGIKRRYFIFPIPDESLGQRVALSIEGAKLNSELEEAILKASQQFLHRYEIPREIIYLERFKETVTGKLDRDGTIRAM